jgi:hypothetical protein
MNGNTGTFEPGDEDIFSFDVSDAALEAAAAATTRGAAMSLPNAPTVSIVVMCCSNGDFAARGGAETALQFRQFESMPSIMRR